MSDRSMKVYIGKTALLALVRWIRLSKTRIDLADSVFVNRDFLCKLLRNLLSERTLEFMSFWDKSSCVSCLAFWEDTLNYLVQEAGKPRLCSLLHTFSD